MKAIFFDLETSDQLFSGQILNYCFLVTDESWEVVDELSGEIRLSRLQLPRAGALLANRIDILEHQKRVKDSEAGALKGIAEFIARVVDKEKTKVPIIGYNSQRFDIPFLRTSFIRNGLNPYFGGKLAYRDMLHAVRSISVRNSDFPRAAYTEATPNKLSLKLETVARELGVLEGVQTHESRDDVLLTIEVARKLYTDFGVDTRKYASFEPRKVERGDVYALLSPEYDLDAESICQSKNLCLLDRDNRSSLWIDLEAFEAGTRDRSALRWFNEASSSFIAGERQDVSEELVSEALSCFDSFNLQNFFAKSTCDIELDIYRLPFPAMDLLREALWSDCSKSVGALKKEHPEGYKLYLRAILAREDWAEVNRAQFERMFQGYAQYRYSGGLQVAKELRDDKEQTEQFHPSYELLLQEIDEGLSAPELSDEDMALLRSLRTYYDESELASALSAAGK